MTNTNHIFTRALTSDPIIPANQGHHNLNINPSGQIEVVDSQGNVIVQNFTGATSSQLDVQSISASQVAVVGVAYLVNTSSGDVTITLPASSSSEDQQITIKKTTSDNAIIIDGDSSETIDGELTVEVVEQYTSLTLASDGINWYIL